MEKDPKYKKLISATYDLSLGISIILAILIGVGIGILLKRLTGIDWLLWLGVFWGIGGALLNVYKVYKRVKKEFDELAKDPKYSYKPKDKNGM